MQDAGAILRIAERLYAAVGTADGWTPALEAVVGLLRAGHAIVHGGGVDGFAPSFDACAGLDEDDRARFRSPEALRLNAPWAAAAPVGIAFSTLALWSERTFERSEFYNEVVRPANGFYGAAAVHLLPLGPLSIGICRARSAGEYDLSEIAALQALLPHLATAVELHCRLQAATEGCEALTRLLGRLGSGVILTDAAACPVFANAQALRIAAEADGLALDGALAGATPGATQRLREAVAAVAADTAAEPQRLALPRPSRRPPLQLAVLPVWRLGALVHGARAPRVAIFLTAPDAPVAIDRETVADAFGLTRRESEVAVLLAEGRDLETIAATLGVRVDAVRQYLKRAFDKTGAHSQAALVARIRGFADPWL